MHIPATHQAIAAPRLMAQVNHVMARARAHRDMLAIGDIHDAAASAERTARDHRDGLASTEALILASDAAFHAARRAERAAEASGCPLMAAAAERARAAYRAGAPC